MDTVMAKRDIQVRHSMYGTFAFPTEANVDVGIDTGDVVKLGGTGANYAVHIQTGDPEQGTDIFLGVIKAAAGPVGANTASADGDILVEIVGPGSVLSGKATTVANIDTATKLKAIQGDYVTFDRSADTVAGVVTIDEDEGSDNDVHALFIIDGDIVKGTLEVFCAQSNIWRGAV